MANYQHKRSAVAGKVPLASDLLDGEIVVNIKDRKLFAKDDQGVVFEFSGGNGGAVDTVNNIAPVNGNVTLNALSIPPTSDRLWLTQAERQLIASFDAYDKVESDDRYLLETNNLSDLTDASAARANLGLGNLATIFLSGSPYHTGNILGTVSQSGGVPTGAIIESGSNVNGRYVKYADGTLICEGVFTYTQDISTASGVGYQSSTSQGLPFPSVFISSPSLSTGSRYLSGTARAWNTLSSLSNSSFAVLCHSFSANTSVSIEISYLAIGRWV